MNDDDTLISLQYHGDNVANSVALLLVDAQHLNTLKANKLKLVLLRQCLLAAARQAA